jgi:hypothetical protein
VYILDTSSIRSLSGYYPDIFPAVWVRINGAVAAGKIISVREAFREIEVQATKAHIAAWAKANKKIFLDPSRDEMVFVSEIFSVPHFTQMIGRKQIAAGSPVADPFVIAAARVKKACVVTEEIFKENGAKIPNICKHFSIDCTNFEGLMKRERWAF